MELLNGLWVPPKPHRISYIINQIKSYINILMYYIISVLKTGEENFSRPKTMDCFRFFLGITTSSQRAFSAKLLSFISNHTAVLGLVFWGDFYGFYHRVFITMKKSTIWENSLGFLFQASNNQIQERRLICFSYNQVITYNHKAMSRVGFIFSANKQNSRNIPKCSYPWWTPKVWGVQNRESKKWKHRCF